MDDKTPLQWPTTPSTWVLVVNDGHGTQVFPLQSRRYSVGRHKSNDIRLRGRFVSRVHAQLIPDANSAEPGFVLCDGTSNIPSTNGTFLNGRLISTQRLQLGDRIFFGPQAPATLTTLDVIQRDGPPELSIPPLPDPGDVKTDTGSGIFPPEYMTPSTASRNSS